ncbi:MAG: type II-A CRISPR-associated protein Csn2 [Clostridiales bacterium]|nr:type II-A CRISPR-associated protein Csn2 [Clostridiales bacterium]
MRINFPHLDESIELKQNKANVIVIENSNIYGYVLFSLYDRTDDYVKIYDDDFNAILDKNYITVFNPLLFDFEERKLKTIVTNYILDKINIDQSFKESIESKYIELHTLLMKYLEDNCEVDFFSNDSVDVKDILKLVGITINQDSAVNCYEKVKLIVETLNEIAWDKLLIFTNLNMLMSEESYKAILELINLNSQTVLIIEGNDRYLSGESYYSLDSDFYLSKM